MIRVHPDQAPFAASAYLRGAHAVKKIDLYLACVRLENERRAAVRGFDSVEAMKAHDVSESERGLQQIFSSLK